MSPDPQGIPTTLAAALADRYRVERQLGRGGMATVYLAHDLKHDRPVALKVLHPELASMLGPDRFLREIRLAARLQHPHILSVHDSGGAATGVGPEQLWFTMPYVEGESLRDRLYRDRQLSIPEAVRIAREASQALRYAHDHGVVHRDIKPENLLLTEDGNTLVADFGIARALKGSDTDDRLTATGFAIGTPAYMSPEQASGSSDVDARSDVYSLGSVLYEMLTGEPPFSGTTAQAMIAKRLAGPAPAVTVLRPNVPATVVEAVGRALAIVPADRFQSMGEFGQALEGTERTARTARTAGMDNTELTEKRRRPSTAILASVLAAVAIAGGLFWLKRTGLLFGESLVDSGQLARQDQLVLADFADHANDSSLAAAVTEAFRVDFAQSGLVGLASPDRVRGALKFMQRPDSARLTAALGREVAVREGLKAVLSGEVTRLGDGYIIAAQVVRADSGQVLTSRRETAASAKDIIPAVDRLSRGLRRSVGESLRRVQAAPPLEAVSTGSLEALRRYGLAVRLVSTGRGNEALPLLRQAVQLDTGFSMAWGQIWVSLFNGNRDLDGQIDALSHAYANRDQLTETQRYATEADYFEWVKRDRPQARRAWEAVLAIDPNHTVALTNLGLLNWFEEDYPDAASLAARAIRSDSNRLSAYTNLLDAQVGLKQYAAADTTLARWRARFGVDREYQWTVGNVAYVKGDFDSAAAAWRRNLDQREDLANRSRGALHLSRLAAVRGRLGDARRFNRLAAETSPDPTDRLGLQLEQASIELSLGVGREDALALAKRVGSSAEFTGLPPTQRPYDQLAMLYALAGQSDRARAVVAEQSRLLAAAGPAGERYASSLLHRMSADAMEGTLLLNEKRFGEAEASFTRAHAGLGGVFCLPQIGMALDRAGKSDSALAVYERYLSATWLYRIGFDPFDMVHVIRRAAEMYEAKGDRAHAIEKYERIVSLWRDADPSLQPQVTDVKRRLADLTGEPR